MIFRALFYTLLLWSNYVQLKAKYAGKNIVLLLNDDQDSYLGGMDPMANVKRYITSQGVTFRNAFVSTPVCCPSRASILTGTYVHNHGVTNNSVSGNCAGSRWRAGAERRTIATYLKTKGYTTFYGGKYLNQYGKTETGGVSYVPPGYDRWVALVGNSRYYNFTLSVDGKEDIHGDDYGADYLTDLLANETIHFIETSLRKGSRPFFVMLSPPACHSPFTPAPQFSMQFGGLRAPRLPNFNYLVKDKHWLMHQLSNGSLTDDIIDRVDHIFRQRWRTLLSVDDMVGRIVKVLKRHQVFDKTYFLITSDHGYHLGQFGMAVDKRLPYEADIRVPMIIKGPSVPANIAIESPVVSIDLAPTILDMARISIPKQMDGVSLLPLLHPISIKKYEGGDPVLGVNRSVQITIPWRKSFLIEYYGEADLSDVDPTCQQDERTTLCMADFSCQCQDARNNTFACLRILSTSSDQLYCQFQDDENTVEHYDMHTDPFQMINLGQQEQHHRYRRLLAKHNSCSGRTNCFDAFC